jgi:hypothetical protein
MWLVQLGMVLGNRTEIAHPEPVEGGAPVVEGHMLSWASCFDGLSMSDLFVTATSMISETNCQ